MLKIDCDCDDCGKTIKVNDGIFCETCYLRLQDEIMDLQSALGKAEASLSAGEISKKKIREEVEKW